MRFSTLLIVALSALILGLSALLAIGCGSSDSGTGGTTSGQQADAAQASESTSGETDGGEAKDAESTEDEAQSDSESGGKPLTKAAFIKEGDAICAGVPNEFRSLLTSLEEERKAAKKPKPSTAEIAKEAAVPPLETAATKFKGLDPPAGDEQKAEAIIGALENAAQGLEDEPTGEFSGPKSPFWEFQQLTKAYGFKACSKL
jgi:hypothetical protein